MRQKRNLLFLSGLAALFPSGNAFAAAAGASAASAKMPPDWLPILLGALAAILLAGLLLWADLLSRYRREEEHPEEEEKDKPS